MIKREEERQGVNEDDESSESRPSSSLLLNTDREIIEQKELSESEGEKESSDEEVINTNLRVLIA